MRHPRPTAETEGRPPCRDGLQGVRAGDRRSGPALVNVEIRRAGRRLEGRPFALLGVATGEVDRGAFRRALEASGLPARFWWDAGEAGTPGPIQMVWNARVDLYILDHHGVIRHKHAGSRNLLEKAIAPLFKEMLQEPKGQGE